MAKQRFLSREVKEDTRGLYVHYGGARLRAPENTDFRVGDGVSMIIDREKYIGLWARVFENAREYELWQTHSR